MTLFGSKGCLGGMRKREIKKNFDEYNWYLAVCGFGFAKDVSEQIQDSFYTCYVYFFE